MLTDEKLIELCKSLTWKVEKDVKTAEWDGGLFVHDWHGTLYKYGGHEYQLSSRVDDELGMWLFGSFPNLALKHLIEGVVK